MFKNKIILITGGTGSFGNAMLKRMLKTDIKEIRIFSRDEKKQDDMRHEIKDKRVKYYIGDVRDYRSILYPINGVDYIFHAAALKQVPSCEFYPMEALKTNCLGVENLLEAAIANEVKKVIVLSTDKAVYPINAMGMTKAIMEKIMIAESRKERSVKTLMCGTRYGNVMASRGSVIPLFIDLIKKNNELTITDPNMTRFLLHLDDAVELVMYAFKNGKPGDIFVKKSPACTILDLATTLKKIFNSNVPMKVIGTRHGEKLFETLVNREEMVRVIDMGGYFRIPADTRDLDYDRYFTEGEEDIGKVEDYNSHNTERLNDNQIEQLLMKLDIVKNNLTG
jgi:UDP-N-acetylglucosamine 4,6-dehydratase/5-epimerase